MGYKITIIGGGSSIFTPQLIALFIKSKHLSGSNVTLMDINPQRLELMDVLSKQLVEKTGSDLKIESTTDRRQSLVDADFVIAAISVGGFDAWENDIEIPAKYGVYQPIGDSVGPGGMMRAFRHVLPMVEICKDLEQVSPHAWVFNYTNPATALCWAMSQESKIKVVSLCTNTVYLRNEKFMANWVGVKPDQVILPPPAAGINHCAGIIEWHLKDGRDAFPMIRKKIAHPVIRWGLDRYNFLPYSWPHWQEFYPSLCKLEGEYKGRLQGLSMSFGHPVHDMNIERGRIKNWEDLVAKWVNGEGEVSLEALPSTQPVQVVEIMEAIIEDRNEVHVVNLLNRGAIENLPNNAVVEVSALVNGQGIHPIRVGAMPEAIAAFLRLHISVQQLTVEAALKGDRKLALQALELEPFVAATLTIEETPKLLDELMAANATYLPQFQ
jgi:alpha-galactosidase